MSSYAQSIFIYGFKPRKTNLSPTMVDLRLEKSKKVAEKNSLVQALISFF